MVADLIRDTLFGAIVRTVSGGRLFRYPDQIDPSIIDKYVNPEKSGNLALHGTTSSPGSKEHEKAMKRRQSNTSRNGTPSGQRQTSQPNEKDDTIRSPSSEQPPTRPSRTSSTSSSATQIDTEGNALVNVPSGKAVDPEKGLDHYLVDWYGPEDAENPQNWSTPKKVFVTFEICLLTFSVYIGSAIYTAGEEDITKVFGVSQVAATLGLTLYVVGYALGPMIFAPMSEIPQIGRNPVYLGTLFIFVVFQVPTALATNFGMLLAFRFLTGFFGSPALATGGASISDMYNPIYRTYGIAIWGIAAVMGPVMGPLIGGFAAEAEGWKWPIWELMWLSGFTLAFLIFFFPETSSANILYRRAVRCRKATGNDKYITEPELAAKDMTGRDIVMMSLVRPFTLMIYEPMVLALNMYIALVYGLLYIWFESFPIVFIEIYGFSLGTEGLAFIGILLGVFIVMPPFVWYYRKYIVPKFNENKELKPEWRLTVAFVGAFCIPICLFMFGWTSRPSVHWIVPIIATSFFAIGTFLLFQAVLNYLGDSYPEYAASILAGNDLLRSGFGAGFPLFAAAMYNNLGVGWASSLLGFLSIAFIPIPFVLFKYGERLRHRSRYARKDL